jgi:signal transduction histidine kinase
MRLSISAKIFLGFLVVLVSSGGVATYGALTVRSLGDELRLVSRGYLELRLQVAEMQTGQGNLLRVMSEQLVKLGRPADGSATSDGAPPAEITWRMPRFIKFAIDEVRRTRLAQQMPKAFEHLAALENRRPSPEEQALLHQLRRRLENVAEQFRADEPLFDEVYGRIGDAPRAPAAADLERVRASAEQLLRRERGIHRDLIQISAELRLRAQQAALRLEESETRAAWATMLLAVVAVLVGVAVMIMATRTVRPLRRLAERAKEIARGDYAQRVDASSNDEIGALGREFNQMAAALEEREQQLIRSERLAAVGKIAAHITHEVRNPLSSVGLNAELLEETVSRLAASSSADPAEVEEARALLRAIGKEVDRLTEITEAYLRFARLPRPRLEREDLRALVQALLSFVQPELAAAHITVEADLPPTLPPVLADENQLRQALLNLLRNAKEAMGDGGTLTLRARAVTDASGAAVELEIGDTGPGIPAEHLAKVFDPFFSTKEGGTGLGLALTQQIIVEHGGAIAVTSAAGRGTTFRLRLPATTPDAREPEDSADREDSAEPEKREAAPPDPVALALAPGGPAERS